MLRARIIPCLLLREGGLVKTQKFDKGSYVGDPINAVKIFNEKEVDELIFLDIDASKKNTDPDWSMLEDLSTECFMPLCYGGGINSLQHIERILRIGIEKVVINHKALESVQLVEQASARFGSSTIVGAIDVKKNMWGKQLVYDHVKGKVTGTDVLAHAKRLEDAGVGEIFLNVVDRDGTYAGYDFDLITRVSEQVSVPLIACGGASTVMDFKKAIKSGASAAAAGSLFVYQGPHRAVLISYPSSSELNEINK
ncbi:AglZ/HisF2 family acetamidino modification protein [Chitinophaga horti]|uniref:imidazole glycerol-phosphate synthase n=1 Tax=Chitinophaga horti TaxID=2920382 RepID=A0ABY6J2K3_9BACT|nr:AglZ/HisF2 family acetamidino modification protein [Chitinophaga horti]UYQ92424.1 AglZ/HisF2 family acetamidino modification protein [Chitinophaga horti]